MTLTARSKILAEWERTTGSRKLMDYPLTAEDWRAVYRLQQAFLHGVRLVTLDAIARTHGMPEHDRWRGVCTLCRDTRQRPTSPAAEEH